MTPQPSNQGHQATSKSNQETLTLEAKAVCAWPRLQTFHRDPWIT